MAETIPAEKRCEDIGGYKTCECDQPVLFIIFGQALGYVGSGRQGYNPAGESPVVSVTCVCFSFLLVRSGCCVEIRSLQEQVILIFAELLRLRQTFPLQATSIQDHLDVCSC